MEKTVVISGNKTSQSNYKLCDLPIKDQTRYKFIRSIGFGGMKSVLLVHDSDTDRDIAMAIMPDFRSRSERDLERFVKEARITAKLEHPNIVPVHDIGKDRNGSPYFTMKYLKGFPLSTLLRRIQRGNEEYVKKYSLEKLLNIYIRICNAMFFAHSGKICHLDLKPDNINVGEYGEVLILDWGLACELDEKGFAKCLDSGLKGTPGYIAPELITNKDRNSAGVKTDIYSLGCILYAILSLCSPFSGLPVKEALIHAKRNQLPLPSQVAPQWWRVPAALEAICLKAMAYNPEDRYASVEELRDEIHSFRRGYAPQAEHASIWKRIGLFFLRNVMWIVIIALTILAILLALRLSYYHNLLK